VGRVGWLALAATLQFLALNGWQADLDPPETATALLAELTRARAV
jgi:hypothetical protein